MGVMMFDNDNLGAEVLSNPTASQWMVLKELEGRINGYHSVADPNNAFCFLSEMGSSLHAQVMREIWSDFMGLYAKRALTPDKIAPFVSDYDIFNLQASPASCGMQLLMPTAWIKQSAVPFNTTYNIVVIPKQLTIIYAGKYWTMYYPIQVLYNPNTGNITANYDISNRDPLSPMSTDVLDSSNIVTYNGVEYLAIGFKVYQYARASYSEKSINASTGFNRTYPFTDTFYAVKVTTYINGAWSELSYNLSEKIYDIAEPTALLTIDNINGNLKIRIPQIYFTKGLVGSIVNVDILTTTGKLNMTVTDADITALQADFMPNTSNYSAMWSTQSGQILVPAINQTTIVGGSDPMDFTVFRNAVIKNALHDTTPVLPSQLQVAVNKLGYSLTEYSDGITDRVYYASSPMEVSSDGRLIPVVVSSVLFDMSKTLPSTIKQNTDGALTILPNTIFDYDPATGVAVPLDDTTVASLAQMSKTQLANTLNGVTYTRQPFHIWLYANPSGPQSKCYNLLTPSLTSLYMNGENNASPVLLSAVSINITHDDGGTGGYTFIFTMKRTTTLTNDSIAQSVVLVQITDSTGTVLNMVATYVGTDTSTGLDAYSVHIDTTYYITPSGYLQCQLPLYNGTTVSATIPLNATFTIKSLVSTSVAGNVTPNNTLSANVPSDYMANYLIVSQQTATVTLGEDLSDIINNNVITNWGAASYATWPVDIPYTYNTDVYQRNPDGSLVVYMNNGTPTLVRLAKAGDPIPLGTDLNLSVTNVAYLGSNTLTLASASGITLNMLLRGPNIPSGTYVIGINGNVITVSNPITNDIPANTTIIAKSVYISTTTTSAVPTGSQSLPLVRTAGLITGMVAYGPFIPNGTTITVSASGVALNAPTTGSIPQGATVTFLLPNGPLSCRYHKGDIRRDVSGNPITVAQSTNIYAVEIIQFDEKVFRSDQATDQTFAASLPSLASGNAHGLDTIRAALPEETYMYYRPYRTMGEATYGAGNDQSVVLPLELSFDIVYYIAEADKTNTDKQNTIINGTLTQVNSYLQAGEISLSQLAEDLKTAFSSMVQEVDVNSTSIGNSRFVAVNNSGALTSVGYKLSVGDDGTLSYLPNLNITFETAPVSSVTAAGLLS